MRPLHNRRLMLVADIRLDNREDLFRSLNLSTPLAGLADSELLFRAWDKWGAQTLDRIAGDFAVAAYDFERQELTLARDPTGQRPLFFSIVDEAVIFASMPSGLLVAKSAQHDLPRMAQMLLGAGHFSERTSWSDVSRVLPAHALTFARGSRSSRQYWQPSLDPFVGRSTSDFIDEYRALLDESVRSHMRRLEGPLATHLSSGFDSSAVCATAMRLAGPSERIIAYTAAPAFGESTVALRGRNIDESPVAARMAEFVGVNHVVVRTKDSLLDAMRGHARYFQEPVRNLLNAGWWKDINRQASAAGAVTMLTAEVGNSTLNTGELAILSEWIRRGQWGRWATEARAAFHRLDVNWRGLFVSSFGSHLPRPLVRSAERLFQTNPSWTRVFYRPHLLAGADADTPADTSSRAAQRLQMLTRLDFGALRKGCLGETGIDQRDPFANRRLAEFSLRLPPEQLLHDGRRRPLAKAALADRLPNFILELPVRGFQGGDWPIRLDPSGVANVVEEISANSTVQALLDLPKIRQTVADWPALRADSTSDLVFGRDFTAALAAGAFIVEGERYPERLGRAP